MSAFGQLKVPFPRWQQDVLHGMAASYGQCIGCYMLIAQVNDLSRPPSSEFARGQPAWSNYVGELWTCIHPGV